MVELLFTSLILEPSTIDDVRSCRSVLSKKPFASQTVRRLCTMHAVFLVSTSGDLLHWRCIDRKGRLTKPTQLTNMEQKDPTHMSHQIEKRHRENARGNFFYQNVEQ